MTARPSGPRRGATALVAVLLPAVLWVVGGASWLPPAAALATVLAVRLTDGVLPRRLRHPIAAGALVAAVVLGVEGPVWMWPLLSAGVVLEVVLLGGHPVRGRGHGRGRVLLAVAAVLAVCGTFGLVVDHIQAQARRAAQWAQTSEINRAQLLPPSPGRAARTLLRAIADHDPSACTTLLVPAAAAQLAAVVGAPDCPATVGTLAARVIDPRLYAAPDSDAIPTTVSPDGQTATADICRLRWTGLAGILRGTTPAGPAPGPQLGRLYLTRVLGQGYQITYVTAC